MDIYDNFILNAILVFISHNLLRDIKMASFWNNI